MNDSVPISMLNDFLFCPYSIYLHAVYQGTEEETCKAVPQKAGTAAHERIERREESRKGLLLSFPVFSETLCIHGTVDEYDTESGELTEYKNHITAVFPGQRIQIQAQCLCLQEMDYAVSKIRLVEISTGKPFPVPIPDTHARNEIIDLVRKIISFNPGNTVPVNPNKCRKCIYLSLCDKTNIEKNDF